MALMFTMSARVLTLPFLLIVLKYFMFCKAGRLGEIDIDAYREKVRQMFYHAYDGYLNYAYPYDELQPLTCKGHDTWGSYSLTLIDAMDTLAVMGNYTEFRRIAQILIDKGESFFDIDINASVFETNIRIVGGLLSGHLLMKRAGMVLEPAWPCSGPLLRMAENVARKILPAFDTPTGMPYGTVNLRHGVPKGETTVTCTAGVGTFIVEFGALSRLTGDPIFEKAAIRAIRALWKFRSPLGLLGNHIDVSNGKWTALDSGIGGGIDSYFEYLIKGAIMFNIPELLHMFREYEVPIRKYLKRGDWYMWAQMNKGSITLPLFTSLDGYWPGIQTLVGDLDDAVKTIHNYHQVWRQFGFTPEYYNIPKAEVHQGREGYPLRPEVIESIMYLYRATKDPYLLEVGVDIVETIEHSARTSCGYATVKDVRDHQLEDRMESFFLAETTKYLYLLFDQDNFIHNNGSHGEVIHTPSGSCVIEAGGYVFNTEAHPIDLAAVHCCSAEKKEEDRILENFHNNLDLLSLLDVFDEADDLPSKKKTRRKKSQLSEDSVVIDGDRAAIIGGPTLDSDAIVSENIDSTKSAREANIDHEEKVEHSKSESKHHLEVIDMTIFTEKERNLTHHFMKEQQIKELLKSLSGLLANKMKEQYRATDMEHLAGNVARKILIAGGEQVDAAQNSTNSSVSMDSTSVTDGDQVYIIDEKDRGDSKSVDNSVIGEKDDNSKSKVDNIVESAKEDLATEDQKDSLSDNHELTENIEFGSGNVDSSVDSAQSKSEISEAKTVETQTDIPETKAVESQLDNSATASVQESPNPVLSDKVITLDITSDGDMVNVMQHKINLEGENKVIVVHLQKTDKEDSSGSTETEEAETNQEDENVRPADATTERFKSHIDLQIQSQEKPEDSQTLLSASPPSERPLTSLETKRNNLLTLTTKFLNIFSGSKTATEKSEADLEGDRTPSLAGLYASLSNYTIRYFHDPAILHCPAQSFHRKISVYGEVFPDE
ncbi:ER degradation-enhancing alpha-mannosidase-like protein 3 [Biomphalaria glabrata]|nr:ER degradation-enhancing alpha-mannosidase-like protein 3 [Biomphalaria glabrata]